MSKKWQNIIPLKTAEQMKQDTPLQSKEMIIDEEVNSKKNFKVPSFFERKKRPFSELEKGFTGSKISEIQNKQHSDYSFPSKKVDNFPQVSVKLPTIESDPTKKDKYETIKTFACESLEKYLNKDERLIDLDKNINTSGVEQIKQKIRYPDILINIFNNDDKEKFSFSGLFMPLNLLYFVKDNIIYLWDYANNDSYTYREITSVIVNLHITLPKQGVFSPDISYIMIVATISEVFIILIEVNSERRALNFIKSDFTYDVQTIITSINSTSERRIFLGSQNNYLFELDYTNTSSFLGFLKRVKKITHSSQGFFEKIIPNIFKYKKHSYISKIVVDNTRKIMYSLTYYMNEEYNIYNMDAIIDSAVQIYDLGSDGLQFQKLGEISQTNLKERYSFQSGSTIRRDEGFVILDLFPITRAESKYFNLVIVTKQGLRFYISFDTTLSNLILKEEEKILDFDKNKIYKVRPTMRYQAIPKQIPEPSNATFIEDIGSDMALRALQRTFTIYNQIFCLEKKFLIFYKDDTKKRSYIDLVEYEESNQLKVQEQYSHFNISRTKETISNILKFNFKKEIYSVMKIPVQCTSQPYDNDFLNLLKVYDYDICLPRNANFPDGQDHTSFAFLNSFAKQLFLPPEELVIMTSSELVTISKLRPIDNLIKIICEVNINDPHIFTDEFMVFLNDYGVNETAFMLITIFSNKNFVFYRKFEESLVHNETMPMDNTVNISNILMMDSCELKNNESIVNSALRLFFKLIEYVSTRKNEIYKEIYENKDIEKKQVETTYIGQVAEERETKKDNFIAYGYFMYLARVVRVFWEESVFQRGSDSSEYATEVMKIHHIKYIQSLLIDFQMKLIETKDFILQKIMECESQLKNSNLTLSYDFSKLSQELKEVIYLSEKFVESLQLVEYLYSLKSLKRHLMSLPPNLFKEMTNLKFKNIILNNNIPMIKRWIEEYFEVLIRESEEFTVEKKLEDLCNYCPSIFTKNDKESYTANMLIKLSKTKENEIMRQNLVGKAVTLICQNPENIRLDKIIKVLSELGEVRSIVMVCTKKAIYLKNMLEKSGSNNTYISLLNFENTSSTSNLISTTNLLNLHPIDSKYSLNYNWSQIEAEQYHSELKQALYLILKLLNEIHLSIKYHGTEYSSTAPDYIKSLVTKPSLTLEDKITMRSSIIEEVLKHDLKFLHDLVFDHLKSNDMLEGILDYDSPYIEPYLSSQIEIESSNPKRYEALYKFYINSNNYSSAIRILYNLVTFDNSKVENEKYVSLSDRRIYANHLIHCLETLIESEKNEETKSFYVNQRSQILDLKDSYFIQAELLLSLKMIYEKMEKEENTDPRMFNRVRNSLLDLDRSVLNLMDLMTFANEFKIYEIVLSIYFEMYKKNFKINASHVSKTYENYFKLLLLKKDLKWPSTIFSFLKNIFINWFETKTKFKSFPAMMIENDFENQFMNLIPLNTIVHYCENLNWNFFFREKQVQIDRKSNLAYDAPDNPFWLPTFLKDVVGLPCFAIFKIYFEMQRIGADQKEVLTVNLNLIHIIKLWSSNYEFYLHKAERGDMISKELESDFLKFEEYQQMLGDILANLYNEYKERKNLLLEEESRKKAFEFCKQVEEKLQSVLNFRYRISKQKGEESLSRPKVEEKKTTERPMPIFTGSILDQCD